MANYYRDGDGRPWINGKPAVYDPEPDPFMPELLSQWRCPDCNARLSTHSGICLNACHLSAHEYREMQRGLIEAQARVQAKEAE